MENRKLLMVIDGYEIIETKEDGFVRVRTPKGTNVTLSVDFILELANELNFNEELKNKLNI